MSLIVQSKSEPVDALAQTRLDQIRPGRRLRSLILRDRTIDADLDLRGVSIKGAAWLQNLHVRGNLLADESHWFQQCVFENVTVDGQIQFEASRFDQTLVLKNVKSGTLNFTNSEFNHDVNIHRASIDGDLNFDHSQFHGGLEIQENRISGTLCAASARCEHWLDASGLAVGILDLTNGIFKSGVEARGATVHSGLLASGAKFLRQLVLRESKIGVTLDLRRSDCHDRLDLVRAEIDHVMLDGSKLQGELDVTDASLTKLIATHAKFTKIAGKNSVFQELRINNSEFESIVLPDCCFSEVLRLSQASGHSVNLTRSKLENELDLTRCTLEVALDLSSLCCSGDARIVQSRTPFVNLSHSLFERRLDLTGLRISDSSRPTSTAISLIETRASHPICDMSEFLKLLPFLRTDIKYETARTLCQWAQASGNGHLEDEARYQTNVARRNVAASRTLSGWALACVELALIDWTVGYGLKPWRVLRTMLFVVILNAALMTIATQSAIPNLRNLTGAEVFTATTAFGGQLEVSFYQLLGRGLDYKVIHQLPLAPRLIALWSSLAGLVLVPLFVGTLTRKLMR